MGGVSSRLTRRRNRYATHCSRCGTVVYEGEARLERNESPLGVWWVAVCQWCVEEELAEPESKLAEKLNAAA